MPASTSHQMPTQITLQRQLVGLDLGSTIPRPSISRLPCDCLCLCKYATLLPSTKSPNIHSLVVPKTHPRALPKTCSQIGITTPDGKSSPTACLLLDDCIAAACWSCEAVPGRFGRTHAHTWYCSSSDGLPSLTSTSHRGPRTRAYDQHHTYWTWAWRSPPDTCQLKG